MEKLFKDLNGDKEISKYLLILANTIETTKKFKIEGYFRKARKNPKLKKVFSEETEGLIVFFKAKKEFIKEIKLDEMNLTEKVKKAIERIYPGKFKNFEGFLAKLSSANYFSVICF